MEDSTTYLEAPALPAVDEPKLIKPENVKSRFWVVSDDPRWCMCRVVFHLVLIADAILCIALLQHFMRYDADAHPDKRTTARCNLCAKDISVKQGTGGLKNHLKFKHPEENSLLFEDGEVPTPVKADGTPAAYAPASGPARKKPRTDAYSEITLRMDGERRLKEKHWMELWALARRELRDVRKELKEEEDEAVVQELENDAKILAKKKADYAEVLGFPKEVLSEEV